MSDWKTNYELKYRNHIIKVKQDFGDLFFLIDGMPTNFGYVVVKDGTNIMRGASWFQTVKEAKHAIDVLINVEGDADMFWNAMYTYNNR